MRMISRTRRRTRLRVTAFPTLRLTVNPKRVPASPGMTKSNRHRCRNRLPYFCARRNSERACRTDTLPNRGRARSRARVVTGQNSATLASTWHLGSAPLLRARLDRESLATLGPSPPEQLATRRCRRALAKTVHLLPAPLVRLIRPLHDNRPPFRPGASFARFPRRRILPTQTRLSTRSRLENPVFSPSLPIRGTTSPPVPHSAKKYFAQPFETTQ